jgi:hypothetical protein
MTALYTYATITVVDDIPDGYVWPFPVPDENGNEWTALLLCNTISELYEKASTLWTEQRYTEDSFLIKYDGRHYPTDIQIKNINGSGYDYTVHIAVQVLDRDGINNNDDCYPWPVPPEPVMEPFDPDVFNTQRAAWEAEHPETYCFSQEHDGPPGMYLSRDISVVNDIPVGPVLLPADPDPWLRCNTISELYEKINALWIEQRKTGASFLIDYNDQRHYPTDIQIKNINGSGYDYTVAIRGVLYDGDTIRIGGAW